MRLPSIIIALCSGLLFGIFAADGQVLPAGGQAMVPAPVDALDLVHLPEGHGLIEDEVSTVLGVVDGDTLTLPRKQEVRLVGLQAPKLSLGRSTVQDWPLSHEAKAAVEALLLDRDIALYYGGRKRDRWGRKLAHVVRDDGVWIQGTLLKAGLARVYSFADNRKMIPHMLALEHEARAAKRGIWADAYYQPRGAENAADHIGSFEIIEAVVQDVNKVRGNVYVNFSDDWLKDLTLRVDSDVMVLFDDLRFDVLALKGKRIEVRGWIEQYNGPFLEITHPEQIQVLD